MSTINQTIQTRILNSAGAPARIQKLVIQHNSLKITLDPSAIAALAAGVTEIKIVKVAVCDSVTGTVRYMLTLASEVFDE